MYQHAFQSIVKEEEREEKLFKSNRNHENIEQGNCIDLSSENETTEIIENSLAKVEVSIQFHSQTYVIMFLN